MPTVLLTGSTGFLGVNLAWMLLTRGYSIRALVRPNSSRRHVENLPIDFIEGDLLNKSDVVGAAKGCDYIIHAGANNQINPARDKAIWEVNLKGTQTILQAAEQTGPQRIVYIGTAGSFGFGTRQQPGNETRPYQGCRYGLDYLDSKHAATQHVLQAVRERGLPAISIHPTVMLGPFDHKPISNGMILDIYKRKLKVYPEGGKNFVYVGDVAVAVTNALQRGRIGESYITGNQNLTYEEVFQLIARTIHARVPELKIPASLAQFLGRLNSLKSRISGQPPLLNKAMIQVACDSHYYSSQKAVDELGLPQTPIEVAVQEAFEWFGQNGYLNPDDSR